MHACGGARSLKVRSRAAATPLPPHCHPALTFLCLSFLSFFSFFSLRSFLCRLRSRDESESGGRGRDAGARSEGQAAARRRRRRRVAGRAPRASAHGLMQYMDHLQRVSHRLSCWGCGSCVCPWRLVPLLLLELRARFCSKWAPIPAVKEGQAAKSSWSCHCCLLRCCHRGPRASFACMHAPFDRASGAQCFGQPQERSRPPRSASQYGQEAGLQL